MDLMTDDKSESSLWKERKGRMKTTPLTERAIGCVSLVIYVVHRLEYTPHRF